MRQLEYDLGFRAQYAAGTPIHAQDLFPSVELESPVKYRGSGAQLSR